MNYRLCMGLFICFFVLSGCQLAFWKKGADPAATQAVDDDLTIAEAYLSRAISLQDSLDADRGVIDRLYQSTFQLLDSLGTVRTNDSTVAMLYAQADSSYNDFLAVNELNDDPLLSNEVLDDLDSLFVHADTLDSLMVADINASTQLTIPASDHRNVQKAIKYFTRGKGRKVMNRWLARAGKYETMIQDILREEGAPVELFYLAMIESGLRPTVRSYARAVGIWQFISATGRAYGLDHSWWYDDRRDVVKASHAAGRHLLDLHERFGDWYIALAGYNFSPGKLQRRIKRYKVDQFWDVPRLPRQTRNYVPTFLAAVEIAYNQEKYGFDIVKEAPVVFDTVTVTDCVDLNVVASIVNSTYKELKTLNPALLRWCTPPDKDRWLLNIPVGTRDLFVEKYDEIPKEKKVSWVHHRVRSGQTLSTIARSYGISLSELKRFNKIRGSLIRTGQSLVIPIPQGKKYYKNYAGNKRSSSSTSSTRTASSSRKPVTSVKGRSKKVYVVKGGDSLWKIANSFGVSVEQIRSWNALRRSRLIKPGQTLNIWLPDGNAAASTATSTTENKPAVANSASEGNAVTHTVRSGDTLWEIAQMYKVSIADIKRWNRKGSNKIKPGEELTIYTR